jgi:hypothetical protein
MEQTMSLNIKDFPFDKEDIFRGFPVEHLMTRLFNCLEKIHPFNRDTNGYPLNCHFYDADGTEIKYSYIVDFYDRIASSLKNTLCTGIWYNNNSILFRLINVQAAHSAEKYGIIINYRDLYENRSVSIQYLSTSAVEELTKEKFE